LTFQFEPIKPALRFDIRGIREEIRKGLEREAKEHRRLLRETVATWDGIKPHFTTKTIVSPQRIFVETTTTGGFPSPTGKVTGAAKWWFLELGTEIRWALMSDDWSSKTTPGELSSGPGAGRVIIAGRRAFLERNIAPRPGIEPRNWRAKINSMRSRSFKYEMQRTFEIIARNIFTPRSLRR
jgi:hypothetical protein